MAKIKPHNFLNTVHDAFTDAMQEGILHLYAEGNSFSGRTIRVKNRDLFHFGTTGYLGLEQDIRLKNAAITAIEHYGTQFPLSKSYISNPLYSELEDQVNKMYGTHTIITKNSTLGHIGVIPSVVDDDDVIILDHQVHWSVQNAAKILKTRSVPIEMIRHNHLDMLESKLKKYIHSKKHIWYMADGIYSMYGDFAPVTNLMELGRKYPQLRFYFDDVHGMSWIGKNGTGYVLDQLGELPHNVLLFGTLSKTFGASGALLTCSDFELYNKIKTFGGPLTFSAQLEPASVAAAIASAKIHLTEEIYDLQNDLMERVQLFKSLIKTTELPLVDVNRSPVFFIGTGMPKTGYNFVNRLMKEGFYVNLGIFPAVPVKNTGVRITISRHNQKKEIKALVDAMDYHFPKALQETQTSHKRVFHAFNLVPSIKEEDEMAKDLHLVAETSIKKITKSQWNKVMGGQSVYNWEGLDFLENTFQNNPDKEHNWKFVYVLIKDTYGEIILATFITLSLWKDDMLANARVSRSIEEQRKTNPYYLTSEVISIGSLFTEGNHLYYNNEHPRAISAINTLIRFMQDQQLDFRAKTIVLRDFQKQTPLHAYLQGQGFVRIAMPATCFIELNNIPTLDDYLAKLSSRNRRHYRKDIKPFLNQVNVKIVSKFSASQLNQVQNLFSNVHKNNLGLNTFSFPGKLFELMNGHPLWEFITVSPKDKTDTIVGVMFCYKNSNIVYVPSFVGLEYESLDKYGTYRVLLLMTINRSITLQISKIDLGMTASFEKKKLGASIVEKYAYMQTEDNFTLEMLGIMEGQR
tara:strand:+ start:2172 stop:4577 length:2406 start_codon:yes stop_codon:yes gene_type:complete